MRRIVMSDQWYYAREGIRLGPFSAQQLKDLAASGQLVFTDTVWKGGVERGVLAAKVKYLFSPDCKADSPKALITEVQPVSATPAPNSETSDSEQTPGPGTSLETVPTSSPSDEVATPEIRPGQLGGAPEALGGPPSDAYQAPQTRNAPKAFPPQHQARKAVAFALSGAVIVSQDGTTVQYRKKCPKCGHEPSSKSRMPIRNGLTRVNFFCPICKKLQNAEIRGAVR